MTMTIYIPAEAGDHRYAEHECVVLREIETSEYPDEWPYRVRFAGGHELTAYAAELYPSPPLSSNLNPSVEKG